MHISHLTHLQTDSWAEHAPRRSSSGTRASASSFTRARCSPLWSFLLPRRRSAFASSSCRKHCGGNRFVADVCHGRLANEYPHRQMLLRKFETVFVLLQNLVFFVSACDLMQWNMARIPALVAMTMFGWTTQLLDALPRRKSAARACRVYFQLSDLLLRHCVDARAAARRHVV